MIKHNFTVELPKKQRKGGQSAPRFGRIRMEKRHNDLKYLSDDKPNVLAGSAAQFGKLHLCMISLICLFDLKFFPRSLNNYVLHKRF